MNYVRDWLAFQKYKRRYRQSRIRFRTWRHQKYLDGVELVFRFAQRLEKWARPRLVHERPEVVFPIGEDRYSRSELNYRGW